MTHQEALCEPALAVLTQYTATDPEVVRHPSGDIVVLGGVNVLTNEESYNIKNLLELVCHAGGIQTRLELLRKGELQARQATAEFIAAYNRGNATPPAVPMEMDLDDCTVALRSFLQCGERIPPKEELNDVVYGTLCALMEQGERLTQTMGWEKASMECWATPPKTMQASQQAQTEADAQIDDTPHAPDHVSDTGRQEAPARRSQCSLVMCAYEGAECPAVWTLRRYRDNAASRGMMSRVGMVLYDCISPLLVHTVGRSAYIRSNWKLIFDGFAARLKAQGYEDTPYPAPKGTSR